MERRRWWRRPAYDGAGHRVGTVIDLVIDVGGPTDPAPVVGVVVRGADRRLALYTPGTAPPSASDGWVVGERRGAGVADLGPTELLVRRDVLDAPVITVSPHRRTRVSDVRIATGTDGVAVVGLDLSSRGILSRLFGRSLPDDAEVVPLSEVHLASPRGHAAQLAAPGALVHGLAAEDLAEVLTRTSVTHAREIVMAIDRQVGERALRLLHPTVRDRVTGEGGPPRRMRRTHGWRLHPPHRHHQAREAHDD